METSQAYRSTVELSFDVRAGLVMRQIHHWAALAAHPHRTTPLPFPGEGLPNPVAGSGRPGTRGT